MTALQPPDDAEIERAIIELIAQRGDAKTICPSEVARLLGGRHPHEWSPLMPVVRRVAVRMASSGRILILRKGRSVDPKTLKGIFRLASLSYPGPGKA